MSRAGARGSASCAAKPDAPTLGEPRLRAPLALIALLSLPVAVGCNSLPGWLGGSDAGMREYRLQVGGKEPDNDKLRDFEKRLEGKEWKGLKAKRTGWRLQQTGDLDEAIARYREALGYDDKDVEAMSYLGRAYRDQGNLYKSATILARAIKTDPDYAEAHSQLGITFDMQGNYAQAEQEHRRAVELDGEQSEYLNNLGFSYFLQGRTNDAVTELRKAINVNPDDKKAHNNLAYIYAAQGRFDQAFAELRRAGTEAEAFNNLGYLYFLKGDRARAIENYNRALQLNYSLKAAQDNLKAATSYGETPPPAPGFDTTGPSPVRVEPPLDQPRVYVPVGREEGGALLFEEPGRGALIAVEPGSRTPSGAAALDAAGAVLGSGDGSGGSPPVPADAPQAGNVVPAGEAAGASASPGPPDETSSPPESAAGPEAPPDAAAAALPEEQDSPAGETAAKTALAGVEADGPGASPASSPAGPEAAEGEVQPEAEQAAPADEDSSTTAVAAGGTTGDVPESAAREDGEEAPSTDPGDSEPPTPGAAP